MEQGSAREGMKPTGDRGIPDNTTDQAGIEGSGCGARDTDNVTEYPLGAGGGFGGGAMSVAAGERRVSNYKGDGAKQQDTHKLWHRILGMGN